MKHLKFFWRVLRLASFELPIVVLAVTAILAISGMVTLPTFTTILTGMTMLLGGALVLWIIWDHFARPRHAFGSASFAKDTDLRRAKLRWRGVILGRKGGWFIRFVEPGHLLTFAPTRSGKGVGCVIPNLLDHKGSVVVTDIKGENYRISADYRATLGEVHAFAPFDTDIKSATFNPIDFIRTGTAFEVDDARLVAEMLVAPDGTEPNHWEREARVLITGLLLYVATEVGPQKRSLRQIRVILMKNREGFEEVLSFMAASENEVVKRIAEGFSQKEDRERSAVISTAQSRMEVFESPQLGAITSTSSFKLEDLKNHTLSLFLIIPPEYVSAYQPFLRLMVGLACAAMTRNTYVPKHDVLFLLDELPALGHMRPIEDGIGYLAGYGAKLWLFVQDIDQLQKNYRKWRSMIANCAVRQAFNVQDPETAQLLSDMLGQTTVKIRSEGRSANIPMLPWANSYSQNHAETGRRLLAPDEIMLLPPQAQLLFVQGCRPIMAQKIRYFKERFFKDRWNRFPAQWPREDFTNVAFLSEAAD